MDHLEGKYAKCPYFDDLHGSIITCEGFLPNTATLTKYASAADARKQFLRCCTEEESGDCVIARTLNEQYARLEQLDFERAVRRASQLRKSS